MLFLRLDSSCTSLLNELEREVGRKRCRCWVEAGSGNDVVVVAVVVFMVLIESFRLLETGAFSSPADLERRHLSFMVVFWLFPL